MRMEVLTNAEAVAKKAAAVIAEEARAAVAARGRFLMAVSGGKTPWIMLRALADEAVPWKQVHVVQVDERVAPAGHADRNLTHLRETLLEHAPLREEQIHAMPVEAPDLEAAAGRYAATLRGDRRLAPGARPRPPGPRVRRPHGVPGARGSGAEGRRPRRGDHGGVPGKAADDLDLSDDQPFPRYFVGRDGSRKGSHAQRACATPTPLFRPDASARIRP